MEQRTEDWFKTRAGKVTASRVADVIAKVKTGESASRANYRAQLVAERLTGQPQESFSNAAMQWGTDTEPLARSAYEAFTGNFIEEIGFSSHKKIEHAGCSPDGLVSPFLETKGLIEIKCPNTATHIDTLLSKTYPAKYKPQMQWQMACTGAEWCDFVSFDPRLPEKHQLFIFRVIREDDYIKMLEEEVIKFLNEVQEVINRLEA